MVFRILAGLTLTLCVSLWAETLIEGDSSINILLPGSPWADSPIQNSSDINDEESDKDIELTELLTEEELEQQDLLAGEEEYWTNGLVIGVADASDWVSGFIWESGELTIEAGAGIQKSTIPYEPDPYQMSVLPEHQSVFPLIKQNARKPVVVRYQQPFFRNIFKADSSYHVTSVSPVKKSFKDTFSFRKHPEGIITSGTKAPYNAFGLIIHVQHYGKWFERECIAYLHKGYGRQPTTKIKVKPNTSIHYGSNWGLERHTGIQIIDEVEYVSNVIQLITYDKSICRYIQDAAISQTEVFVEYSGYRGQPGSSTYSVIQNIKAHSPDTK